MPAPDHATPFDLATVPTADMKAELRRREEADANLPASEYLNTYPEVRASVRQIKSYIRDYLSEWSVEARFAADVESDPFTEKKTYMLYVAFSMYEATEPTPDTAKAIQEAVGNARRRYGTVKEGSLSIYATPLLTLDGGEL